MTKPQRPRETAPYILWIVEWAGGSISKAKLQEACGHRRDFDKSLRRLKREGVLHEYTDRRPNRPGPKPVMIGREAP